MRPRSRPNVRKPEQAGIKALSAEQARAAQARAARGSTRQHAGAVGYDFRSDRAVLAPGETVGGTVASTGSDARQAWPGVSAPCVTSGSRMRPAGQTESWPERRQLRPGCEPRRCFGPSQYHFGSGRRRRPLPWFTREMAGSGRPASRSSCLLFKEARCEALLLPCIGGHVIGLPRSGARPIRPATSIAMAR